MYHATHFSPGMFPSMDVPFKPRIRSSQAAASQPILPDPRMPPGTEGRYDHSTETRVRVTRSSALAHNWRSSKLRQDAPAASFPVLAHSDLLYDRSAAR